MGYGAAIAAGEALIGDMMSAGGQGQANQANWSNMVYQDTYNAKQAEAAWGRSQVTLGQQDKFAAQQAAIARNYNSAQVLQQEQFQNTEMQKAENYNTLMSNTAEQRRMADLKAAGVNPLLGVTGLGGASSPVVSQPTGAAATSPAPSLGGGSSAQAMAAGTPNMLNTQASFANLGASAANINLQHAQTENIKADTQQKGAVTNDLIPAQVAELTGRYNLQSYQAEQVANNMQSTKALLDAQVKGIDYSAELDHFRAMVTNQEWQVQRATQQELINMLNQKYKSEGGAFSNSANVQNSWLGQALAVVNAILQPVSTAAGIARGFGGGGNRTMNINSPQTTVMPEAQ